MQHACKAGPYIQYDILETSESPTAWGLHAGFAFLFPCFLKFFLAHPPAFMRLDATLHTPLHCLVGNGGAVTEMQMSREVPQRGGLEKASQV